jgi:hypothetical protein
LGLLLLRCLVAFILLTRGIVLSRWLPAVIVLTGAGFLLLGLTTPIVAVVIGLISFGMGLSTYDVIELLMLTSVIALLGPGGFSIDARLFGRREVLIPARASELPAAPVRPRR